MPLEQPIRPATVHGGSVRAQLVGEAALAAHDAIPYESRLSEANIHVLIGEAALKAAQLPLLGTHREWAVQVRTFIDGDFDKTFTEWNGKRYTEEEARRDVERWQNHPSGARLLYRDVPDWSVAEEASK